MPFRDLGIDEVICAALDDAGIYTTFPIQALTLPLADEAWLGEFAAGLGGLAREHRVALIGGDTTQGPLCISVQLSKTARAPAESRRHRR